MTVLILLIVAFITYLVIRTLIDARIADGQRFNPQPRTTFELVMAYGERDSAKPFMELLGAVPPPSKSVSWLQQAIAVITRKPVPIADDVLTVAVCSERVEVDAEQQGQSETKYSWFVSCPDYHRNILKDNLATLFPKCTVREVSEESQYAQKVNGLQAQYVLDQGGELQPKSSRQLLDGNQAITEVTR